MKRALRVILTMMALGAIAAATPALASSHREAPSISQDPVADNTDVYMFRSSDSSNTVTMLGNYVPMEEPAGGPNFYRFGDNVVYRFNVFNNKDQKVDVNFEFRFKTQIINGGTFLYNTGPIKSLTDPSFNIRQTYTVTMSKGGKTTVLGKDISTPPCSIGPSSTPNYPALAAMAVKSLPGGIKVFAGQRDDSFFADTGGLFDLLTIRKLPGNAGGGIDGLSGFNVQTIALQVPISMLTANGSTPTDTQDANAVIGMFANTLREKVTVLRVRHNYWITAQRRGRTVNVRLAHRDVWERHAKLAQVSRLAQPLINEVVIPLGRKDLWNVSNPVFDVNFLKYYQDPEVGKLLTALYGIPVPPAPRADLPAILLTGFALPGTTFTTVGGPPNADLIRLNVAVPAKFDTDSGFSRLGVLGGDLAGFPNGRRPSDDVVDIELQAIAGATPFTPTFNVAPNNQLGDGVNANDASMTVGFPTVPTPWSGFSHPHVHQ